MKRGFNIGVKTIYIHLRLWVKVCTMRGSRDEDGRSKLVQRVGDAQSMPGVERALRIKVYFEKAGTLNNSLKSNIPRFKVTHMDKCNITD